MYIVPSTVLPVPPKELGCEMGWAYFLSLDKNKENI
jgi:hypothetical protein